GVTSFLRAASERIILTTPEPHAITDAYALMKVLAKQGGHKDYGLLVNRVSAAAEGEKIGEKMQYAGRRFLGVELNVLGSIAEDPWVARSIRAQEPLVLMQPDAKSAVDIRRLAGRLAGRSVEAEEEGAAGLGGFLRRIRRIWRRHDAAAE